MIQKLAVWAIKKLLRFCPNYHLQGNPKRKRGMPRINPEDFKGLPQGEGKND